MRIARRHGRPVRRARQRHRPRGRRDAARRPGRHRHHPDEPGARGRPAGARRVGRARACSTSTSPARSRHLGLHYAPDPSSQQACTIGGNVATNAGGPHCLADGRHLGARARGRRRARRRHDRPGSAASRPTRPATTCGAASSAPKGTMGIATRIAVRLTPDPPRVATMLCAFDSIDAAAATVSGIIAAGVLPAALEMMDARITARGRGLRRRRLPARRARRCCSSRSTGSTAASPRRSTRSRRSRGDHGATSACASRPTTPSARCCGRAASRRSARSPASRPTTTCTTRSCPARKLVEVLRRVYEIADAHELIAMNVFHAGDGNLHPLHRVRPARARRVGPRVRGRHRDPRRRASTPGGVLTGEHGVGIEKRDLMPLHVLAPTTSTRRRGCATRSIPTAPPTRRRCCRAGAAAASCSASRRARGSERASSAARPWRAVVAPVGARTQWEVGGPPPAGATEVRAPAGVDRVRARRPDDHRRRGHARSPSSTRVARRARPGVRARPARSRRATIGGILACGLSGIRRLRHGPLRDHVLEVRFVTGDGRLVKGGGPTVKNVTGYDLPAPVRRLVRHARRARCR